MASHIQEKDNMWQTLYVQTVFVYGPQVNYPEDIRESFYDDVSVQFQTAALNGDSVKLVGDFNAKLGRGVIRNDIHPLSKMVSFCLFNKYNITLLNTSDSCTVTFTRIHKYRQQMKSQPLNMFLFLLILENTLFKCTLMNEKLLLLCINLKVVRDFLTNVL